MKVVSYSDVEARPVEAMGAINVTKRVLISENDGAKNFRMRCFEVGPGGATPYHQHSWEHEVFILEGEGACIGQGRAKRPVRPGDAVFISPNEWHSFVNKSSSTLRFLCIIPSQEV